MPNIGNFEVAVENNYKRKSALPSFLEYTPYLGAAVSFLNTAFGGDRTDDYINQQFENNVKMWSIQNQYNTPANQINRLKQAGLNPLFYGIDGNRAAQLSPVDVAGAANASAAQENVKLAKQQQALSIAQGIANVELTKAEASKARTESDMLRNTQEEQEQTVMSNLDFLRTNINNLSQDAISKTIANVLTAAKYGYYGVSDGLHDFKSLDDVFRNYLPDTDYKSDVSKELESKLQHQFDLEIKSIASGNRNLNASALANEVSASFMNLQQDMFKKYGITKDDNVIFRILAKGLKSLSKYLGVDLDLSE